MLLINELPVAHIEEKDESLQNQWNAFEQFQKYDDDGMYTGLFSFVQVQFVLSQNSAHLHDQRIVTHTTVTSPLAGVMMPARMSRIR